MLTAPMKKKLMLTAPMKQTHRQASVALVMMNRFSLSGVLGDFTYLLLGDALGHDKSKMMQKMYLISNFYSATL